MKVGDQYIMDIHDELEQFKFYHRQYALETVPSQKHEEYVIMTLEQMLSHFDVQSTAVQAFVGHYVNLLTEQTSLGFKYHPLHFIHRMNDQKLQQYAHCLWGFAESIFKKFLDHGMYTQDGRLRAAFERVAFGQLHLVIRPEVPDVFHL